MLHRIREIPTRRRDPDAGGGLRVPSLDQEDVLVQPWFVFDHSIQSGVMPNAAFPVHFDDYL